MIETVRGPITSSLVGSAHMHTHLKCDVEAIPARFTHDVLDDEALVVDELGQFRELGGTTVVDLTLPAIGRDPVTLRRISEVSGLNIVMGCGWYRQPYFPPEVEMTTTAGLARLLIREIEEGVGETGIRPGIIGEVGSHKEHVTGTEERVIRAAGRAAVATGLSVATHSLYNSGLAHIDILREEGLQAERIIVGHADARLHPSYHRAIIDAGAILCFDQIGMHRATDWPDERLCSIISDFVADGYSDRIVISTDVCKRSHLTAYGGVGYGYLLSSFVPRLRSQIGDEATDQILVENPRRLLDTREYRNA